MTTEEILKTRLNGLGHWTGNTPLLAIDFSFDGERRVLYAKAENLNMTGSVKDRMTYHVLRRGYERGTLRPGAMIVEATSGNTGVAFSAFGRALGHPSIASPSPSPSATGTPEPIQAVVAEHPRVIFTTYNLEPVSGKPSLRQDAIDPQMGNVLVPLVLSAEQLEYLAESGVVASPADYPEFHVLYKETVRNNLPVFVTSDSLLHAYHLTFDQLLSSLEEEVFLPKLRELNQALLAQVQGEYEQVKGTAWEDAARHLYAYLAVGSKLADTEFQLPEVVKDL